MNSVQSRLKSGHFKKVFRQKYILASRSPRRIALLRQIGLNFRSVPSGENEFEPDRYDPVKLVKHNSELKSASSSGKFKRHIIIGADTVVCIGGRILHKPSGEKQAIEFLRLLSGRKHSVYTGISIVNTMNGKKIFDYEKTDVYFRKIEDEELRYYVRHYKPFDKAGAYGIQDDFGCLFIRKITGDYYNIVGLPLLTLYRNLAKII